VAECHAVDADGLSVVRDPGMVPSDQTLILERPGFDGGSISGIL